MKKKTTLGILIVGLLVLCMGASVFADTAIKLYMDGKEIKTDVAPVLVNNRVLAPVRAISEALGMDVTWKDNAVYIESKPDNSKMRIQLLEAALAPKDALSAAEFWAEGVKTRNGALQFAVMSPSLREEKYSYFEELNWVTGTSSPWVEKYTVKEINKTDKTVVYEVEFVYTDSTGTKFSENQFIIVEKIDDKWLVSSVEDLDVEGAITEINLEGDKVVSFFVKNETAGRARYSEALVIIGEETKIYKGYTNTELKASDLTKGQKVEVTFTDNPMIMIYPPQAVAKTIRVMD